MFVLYTILKQSIIIVQGVIVCLYVIQFTRYRRAVSLSLTAFLFYHNSFHLSRTFFKFFQIFLRCFSLVVLANNSAMLAHPPSFVKLFFQDFSNSEPIRYSFLPPESDLHILARPRRFVKHYFPFLPLIFSVFWSEISVSFFLILHPFSQDSSPCGSRNQVRNPQASDHR